MKLAATVCAEAPALARPRVADYLELTKPRIAVMVLVTVAVGAVLASKTVDLLLMLHAVLGTGLVAAGASALNQLMERGRDARMVRTENRPLPAGRLQPGEVLLFGLLLTVAGIAYLALALPTMTAAGVATATFLGYVVVYTPLKPLTTMNTLIGAVPGALPPVIGWTAIRGTIGMEAAILFAILFLWQLPHFLAIAWIYRDDYARGGYKMLPVVDAPGRLTAQRMTMFCVLLLAVSVMPVLLGQAHTLYLVGALVLGVGFLGTVLAFGRRRTDGRARRVLRGSLVYLPGLLALLLLDRVVF